MPEITSQSQKLGDWLISWGGNDEHRFWCSQKHPSNSRLAAIVMLNPGSLTGKGDDLSRDTTLRILRELFENTSYNPFVINLFSLAAPRPSVLFEKWERRNHPSFSYGALPIEEFSAVMYAYGDYENGRLKQKSIKERIMEVRAALCGIPEIQVSKNISGTPKHPLSVQRQRKKDVFREQILKHARCH